MGLRETGFSMAKMFLSTATPLNIALILSCFQLGSVVSR